MWYRLGRLGGKWKQSFPIHRNLCLSVSVRHFGQNTHISNRAYLYIGHPSANSLNLRRSKAR
jgi:hypothetical protein